MAKGDGDQDRRTPQVGAREAVPTGREVVEVQRRPHTSGGKVSGVGKTAGSEREEAFDARAAGEGDKGVADGEA